MAMTKLVAKKSLHTRPVKAVRFITKNTIEERMSQLQEKKQLAFDACVDGKQFLNFCICKFELIKFF